MRALQTLRTYRVDGIMLNSSEISASAASLDLCKQMMAAGKPIILSGIAEAGIEADRLGLRNEAAVAKAVRYLLGKGHKRIGFVGGRCEAVAMSQRHRGYARALKEAAVKVPADFSIFSDGSMPAVCKQVDEHHASVSAG